MKATGIVRHIDGLGRVVIPKEIRRTMGIHEGEALEIYTDDGAVIFKKYDANLVHDAQTLLDNVRMYLDADRENKTQIMRALEQVVSALKKAEV